MAEIGNIVASVTVTVRSEAEVKAEALREAAEEVPLFEFMLVMDVASEVAPAQIGAWLRDRADALERPGRADAGD